MALCGRPAQIRFKTNVLYTSVYYNPLHLYQMYDSRGPSMFSTGMYACVFIRSGKEALWPDLAVTVAPCFPCQFLSREEEICILMAESSLLARPLDYNLLIRLILKHK